VSKVTDGSLAVLRRSCIEPSLAIRLGRHLGRQEVLRMNNQHARQVRQPANPRWARAVGTVVGVEQRRSGPTGIWAVLAGLTFVPNVLYHERVQFTTPDGRTVVFTSAWGSPDSDLELGRSVPVRYRPEDPEHAQVDPPVA
jgi:hypothetical protein